MLDEVEAFVDSCIERGLSVGEPDREEEFDRLARRVFAFQFETVPLYRRLCEIRGVEPGSLVHWSGIPAAPADLFKEDIGIAEAPGTLLFLSSGTTRGGARRSRHLVSPRSYALYRRSSLATFRTLVLPDGPGPMQVLLLGPLPDTHPHSSLAHMIDFVAEAFAARDDNGQRDVATFFDADGQVDVDGAIAALEAAAAGTRPLLIFALTTTITALFEALRARRRELRLPADSRLVDTGGSKGGRVMSRGGILHAAWRFLHIPAYLCVAEYGMTELLSQFYDDALYSRWSGRLGPRAKLGPPWTRTLAVDPATLAPLPPGRRGILRHVDLANVGSISALQTLDIGFASGRGFEVSGRADEAEARGCSQLMSVVSAGPSGPETQGRGDDS